MNSLYHTSENKIILTGDIFSIKKAGEKWDAARKRVETEKKHLNRFSQMFQLFQSNITQTLNRGYPFAYGKTGKLVTGKNFLKHPTPMSLNLNLQMIAEISISL